jgi:hypothetical protein
MSNPDYDSPKDKIQAKLHAAANAMAAPPPWHDAWAKLTRESTDEDRLAVYQAIRRAATLPDEASFFLVSTLIDNMATDDAEDALHDYERRLKAIEKQYRLSEGGVWPSGTAPAGYGELRQQYYRAWGEVFAAKLEQLGEPEMAQFFRGDEERFNRLVEAGREYFFGSEGNAENVPEVWVRRLVKAVADCMEVDSLMGPLGFGYGEDDGLWQIDVYPTPVELVGGAVDGEVVATGFSLDVEQLRGLFERIDAVAWQSLGFPHAEGPHVSIEGLYQGHEVFIQVLAYAPDDEEPGMKLDTMRRDHS